MYITERSVVACKQDVVIDQPALFTAGGWPDVEWGHLNTRQRG